MKRLVTGLAVGNLTLATLSPATAGYTERAMLDDREQPRQQLIIELPSKKPAVVLVIKQDLENFLKIAARRNGLSLNLSGNISGTLANASLPIAIDELLDRLSSRFDLAWGISGSRLFVSPASMSREINVNIPPGAMILLRAAMSNLGPVARRNSVRLEKTGSSVTIYGPASHIDTLSHELIKTGK